MICFPTSSSSSSSSLSSSSSSTTTDKQVLQLILIFVFLLLSVVANNNNNNNNKAANEVEISLDEASMKVSEKWWAIGLHDPHSTSHTKSLMDQPSSYRLTCSTSSNLSPGQFKFCRNTEDHMSSVFKGAGMAIMECQNQFKDRRWNCSVVSKENVFGVVADKATRESAFIHALMAAGVVHAVSRACRDGELTTCGCSKKSRPKKAIRPNWLWGGCGDNTDHGYKFANEFIDVAEKEINFPRHSPGLGRMLMNLHNNEVGRRAVFKFVKIGCKCHGVSGSCNVRTCWNQLPSFRQTGDRLRDRFDAAIKVAFNRQGTRLVRSDRKFKRATKDDLLYTDKSPDFCEADPSVGSFGTRGRQCDRHSSDTGGCNLMCCGRGYRSQRTRISERCNCRFQWCCQVSCQTCEKMVEVQICK